MRDDNNVSRKAIGMRDKVISRLIGRTTTGFNDRLLPIIS
jgi:hypothetical protein